jgi:hypothetical protein
MRASILFGIVGSNYLPSIQMHSIFCMSCFLEEKICLKASSIIYEQRNKNFAIRERGKKSE